ncbi:alginate lyase family protein [Micromonospora sp. WMMD1102]|uniref:alginate lyase family protein n=1 Tax=Micromonospora sp. WMMD1102 TaxID=3016105 RepID=UPI0024151532|nr:alginate lyase family protein [Micromonospora sp. WMMD1102]MDG4788665.1 alginate lyase family protein [Micromonospora sp. WMMD1102]
MRRSYLPWYTHRRTRAGAAAALVLALVATVLSPGRAAAADMSDRGELLDLTRPELAAVAAELTAGDEAGAAAELKAFYAGRTDVEYLPPSADAGGGDATADELAAGIFRFGAETRDFYDDAQQRIDVDWQDAWGGTQTTPGGAQVLMSDLAFMPRLVSAYAFESDPAKRASYASAWMDISLDFFADNQSWPQNRNLSGAKRLAQLVSAFAVFRTDPGIDASDLVAYLSGVHFTTKYLVGVMQVHVGNNWYVSMARSVYAAAVFLPEFSASPGWEWFGVRSLERFLRAHVKGDGVYREPAFNYQAYVADLLNTVIRLADANGRTLPESLAQTSDWIADSLFATRQPNLEVAMVGDSPNADAGASAIGRTGARNSWPDFTWVASGRTQGTTPTLPSTVFPISFAVQRSGWDADARYMLINNQNSSYTASHRHPDDLSLVMAAYGRPLIVDSGVGDYSATPTNDWMRRTTAAHNTIEVDGDAQTAGVPRKSSLWRSNAGLDIYRGTTEGYRPIVHDRAVYFVKPGYWIVSDDLTGATAAHDYRQLWHFPGDPVTVNPTTKVATVGFDTVPGAAPVAGVRLVPVAPAGTALTPSVHDDGAVRVGEQVRTDVDYLSYDWRTTGSTGLDTVVVPGPAGAAPTVTATRIAMSGVAHSVATAMQIGLPNATGRFYLSREANPSSRAFGTATTNAETAYLERASGGGLTRYALTRGSSLVDQGATVVAASAPVSDVSVELSGATARISLGDPFTGTLSVHAPNVSAVTVNNTPTAFTRTGDLVTVSVQASFAPTPVLNDEFADASLDRTVHDFNGSFDGWTPVQGSWALTGAAPDTQLAQNSTADMMSFAALHDVPDDVVMAADIVPGTRGQTTARTGLAFRYHDARNYYRANVLNSSSDATLQLVKIYDGETMILAETALPDGANIPHKLVVSAIGRHLSAKVGDTSISADDSQLPTGGAAAFTHRRAATFDNIVIREGIDQANWRAITGSVSVASDQLQLTPPSGGRAHVLADSTLPARFSEACDFVAETTVTINGSVGNAGISLRDTSDSYGYRIHIGKTSEGTRYANIIREAHASGPVGVGSAPISNPLTGPVRLGAAIHGDRITVTLNGVQILAARDTVIRSGGVGLYASTQSTFENITVARSC